MGRKKGKPAYSKKNRPSSFVTTKEAWFRLKSAERRTGKSRSDIITHCVMKTADSIRREDFDPPPVGEIAVEHRSHA